MMVMCCKFFFENLADPGDFSICRAIPPGFKYSVVQSVQPLLVLLALNSDLHFLHRSAEGCRSFLISNSREGE